VADAAPVSHGLINRRARPGASNLRVARVLAAAEETFGSQEKAGAWLRRPTVALAGERPLELLDTDEGSREVETLLGRISHGIAA
jgi:putative toxin-antitoxin system antitoxin component (TIGR02293 family)